MGIRGRAGGRRDGARRVAPPATALDLAPCPGRSGIQCGTLTVPLDRTGATPGTTALRVQRLPARTARRGTLLLLPDGPGRAALTPGREDASIRARSRAPPAATTSCCSTRAAPAPTPSTAPTWRARCAAPCRWPPLARASRPAPRPLGARARPLPAAPTRPRTSSSCARELGVDRLVVAAVGYGAVAALQYARTHPTAWRAWCSTRPVDPEALDGLDLEALRTVPAVLAEICVRRTCRAASRRSRRRPDARRAAAAHAAADRHRGAAERPARPRRPSAGPRQPRALLELLAAWRPPARLRAGLPAALRAARAGDGAPLLRLAARVAAVTVPGERQDARHAPGHRLPRRVAALDRRHPGAPTASPPWPRPRAALGDDAPRRSAAAAILGGSLASLCTAWPHGPQAASGRRRCPTCPCSSSPGARTPAARRRPSPTRRGPLPAAPSASTSRTAATPCSPRAPAPARRCSASSRGARSGTPCRTGAAGRCCRRRGRPATLAGTRPAPVRGRHARPHAARRWPSRWRTPSSPRAWPRAPPRAAAAAGARCARPRHGARPQRAPDDRARPLERRRAA